MADEDILRNYELLYLLSSTDIHWHRFNRYPGADIGKIPVGGAWELTETPMYKKSRTKPVFI
jgi:hypothetical protein